MRVHHLRRSSCLGWLRRAVALVFLPWLCLALLAPRPALAADTCSRPPVDALSVQGDRLLIDGNAEFLPFVTYFDALRTSPEQWENDLNYFCAHAIRGVRIFANWRVNTGATPTTSSIFNRDGTLVSETRTERNGQDLFRPISLLDAFLDKARSKGIVVDLVFDTDIGLSSRQAWANGVLAVVSRYAGSRRHVMIDLSNEYPAHDVTPCDIAYVISGKTQLTMPAYGPTCTRTLTLQTSIRALDPQRVVTASADPGGIVHVFGVPEARVSPIEAAATYASLMGLDIITFHDGRPGTPAETPGWAARTGAVIDALRRHAGEPTRPIFLDEPCRVGSTASTRHCPKAAAPYVRAAALARGHGAAAWTYHTETGMGPYSTTRGFAARASASSVDIGVIGVPHDGGARTPLGVPR